MTLAMPSVESRAAARLDPLGILITAVAGSGFLLPFAVLKANRIVPGEGLLLWQALPVFPTVMLVFILLAVMGLALFRVAAQRKFWGAAAALIAVSFSVGLAATETLPPDNSYARVSIGAGFWMLAFAFSLMMTDALTRLKFPPLLRLGMLGLGITVVAALLWSGAWDDLSILAEYRSRAAGFWREAQTHLLLALGSVALALAIGVPIGIACYKFGRLRVLTLNFFNIIQTIPSIALFGVLIAPLGWVAANLPGASEIGISGIGAAPAMVALVAYALLPIIANTLAGLTGLPSATVEAARGMGMTWRQRLLRVELPLALPVILTGIRIVLVQNIGLATVAALIGGGGFGVFVFQGIGQTAIDLVLLGAVPTVALAFAAAVLLDSFVELASRKDAP